MSLDNPHSDDRSDMESLVKLIRARSGKALLSELGQDRERNLTLLQIAESEDLVILDGEWSHGQYDYKNVVRGLEDVLILSVG